MGSTLQANGQSVTLAGVAGGGFQGVFFPTSPAEIFVPVTVGAVLAPELEGDILSDDGAERFQVVARLASGVSMQTAEAAIDTAARTQDMPRLADSERRRGRAGAAVSGGSRRSNRTGAVAAHARPEGASRRARAVAGANLAGLLLARAGERRREMAVRFVLGAGRWGLIRQLLTESVLLALGGGAAGLFFSHWLLRVADSMNALNPLPYEMNFSFGPTVWLFAVAIAVPTGVGLGLAPLLRYRRFGVRNLFVTYQVAVALMLLLTIGQLAVGYSGSAASSPGSTPPV